ncbi:Thrombospondin type-1 domain-containing protein 4 [Orchesella cincta]|uniref:Thrombospondin type-1 domain-containing protein 4 n=1 Tax=Orchesella cincta TaxID=48709 RepID=A0A1D2MZK3_ORCCI|nr:Thrombospondin type-1 domain-containing protein 4 [Orchesella cincta]
MVDVIGCDGIAGSTRRLDLCGVCGGDNSTCRVVSGIFTRPQLNLGYNVVAHIPKGACNLNITEIRKSPNHLALRKLDGTFIVNGDWHHISWPGVYDGAGTQFQYARNDLKSLESISSAGPLKEPVDLMVLYQQPNPGIKYEYILPLSDAPIPPAPLQDPPQLSLSRNLRQPLAATSRPGSFVNVPQAQASTNTFVIQQHPQSSQPANPFNTISSFPLKSLSSSQHDSSSSSYNGKYSPPQGETHPHLHNHHGRRRNHGGGGKRLQSSADGGNNAEGKKFYWKITGYTNCSVQCASGTQRSIIRCVRGPVGNPVSDRRCTSEEKPPGQTIRCNLKPCPAQWVLGEWSQCSATECGEGFKTRSIHCEQKISPTLTMRVTEGACLQKRPETEVKCQLKPCHHWETSEWSQCSARCGNGVRKRVLKCVGPKGQRLSLKECEQLEKPAELTPCNMGPCEGVNWFVSEWSSECSQRCGAGKKTRHVICSSLDQYQNESVKASPSSSELESNIIEDDDDNGHHRRGVRAAGESGENFFCDESAKPEEERECFSDRSCGEPVWFTGPWGDCSSSVYCGTGLRTRQVLCIIFSRGKFKVVTDPHCPSTTRPEEKELCESSKSCPSRWFTTEWSECSAFCGTGIQKRSVSCRASNWTLPSSLCSDKERPVERRSCNEHKCSLAATLSSSLLSTKSGDSSSNTDASGMVKDKPLQQQAAGTSSTSPPPTTTSSTPPVVDVDHLQSRSSTNSNVTAIISNRNSSRGGSGSPSKNLRLPSHHLNQEPNEEPEPELECTDQYRNCALVVQARLCRYKYYLSVCCNSCADAV